MQHFLIDGLAATDRCWPPSSPDLTPLDFLPLGYVKDRVFATPVNDIELRTRIRDVFSTITGEMLRRTFQQEFKYRLDIVRATNVAHVEV